MENLSPKIIIMCAAVNAQGQAQLAAALGVTRVTLSRWAAGSMPSARHVKQLADMAGVSVIDLLHAFGAK
jgi:transcriptional regulator with XRE-family HTH domain